MQFVQFKDREKQPWTSVKVAQMVYKSRKAYELMSAAKENS